MEACKSNRRVRSVIAVIAILIVGGNTLADERFIGQWAGTWVSTELPVGRWASQNYPTGASFEANVFATPGGDLVAQLYVPELGLFDTVVFAFVLGDQLFIPLDEFLPLYISGYAQGDGSLSGLAQVPNPVVPAQLLVLNWQLQRRIDPVAGLPPGPNCDHDVPLYCVGDAEFCTGIVPFSPAAGDGYLDYPVRDETDGNQYRSFVRRDLAQMVQFAAAELACKTASWDFGNKEPLGLGDGSHADGSSPTLHISHTEGRHLDIAYPQLYASDNLLRRIGRYIPLAHPDYGTYLIGPPAGLDALRSALFIAYMARHPNLRFIAVDEQAGLLIEAAFDELEALGWLPPGTRDGIRLLYEKDDVTAGHADHMHVAMNELEPVVESLTIRPKVLQRKSNGQFVTAMIQFAPGFNAADIDASSLTLIVDGNTATLADERHVTVPGSNTDGANSLTVKFDRSTLNNVLEGGEVEVAVTGSVDDVFFQVSETITVK